MLHCFIISFHLLPQKKNYFTFWVFKNDSNLFLKKTCFSQKWKFYQKAPPVKVEGFQISFFDLIQTSKIAFTNNC